LKREKKKKICISNIEVFRERMTLSNKKVVLVVNKESIRVEIFVVSPLAQTDENKCSVRGM